MDKTTDIRCALCEGWFTVPINAGMTKYCPMCRKEGYNQRFSEADVRAILAEPYIYDPNRNPIPNVEDLKRRIAYTRAQNACAVTTEAQKPTVTDDLLTEWGSRPYENERNPSRTCACGRKAGGRCQCGRGE